MKFSFEDAQDDSRFGVDEAYGEPPPSIADSLLRPEPFVQLPWEQGGREQMFSSIGAELPQEESIPQLIGGALSEPLDIAGKGVVGLLNLPGTIKNTLGGYEPGMYNYVEPKFIQGQPLNTPFDPLTEEEGASYPKISGAYNAGANFLNSLTAPETLFTLPVAGSRKALSYFLANTIANEPAAIENAINTYRNPDATPMQKAEAVTGAAVIQPGMAALMGLGLRGGRGAEVSRVEPELPTLRRDFQPTKIAEVPDAILQESPQPVRSVREQPREVPSEVPATPDSSPVDAGRGKGDAPKAPSEIDRISALGPDEFNQAIKDSGIGLTSMAYRMAERLKTEDIPALEAAQNQAHAQRKELVKGSNNIQQLEKGVALGLKGQMFNEAIKWRKALDEAKATGASMQQDFAALERKYGVGESKRFGGDLQSAFEREKAATISPESQKQADIKAYNELTTQRNKLIEQDKGFTPEDIALWKQIEAIKNKYGGMPPEMAESAVPVEQLKSGPRPMTDAEKAALNPKRFSQEQAKKVDGPELENLEIESVSSLDPASGTPLSATDSLINKLEGLKFAEATEGRLYSLPHPDAITQIGKTAWNNGIDVAIAAIKTGKQVGDAINEAISYIKKNASGFDEAKARANLETLLKEEKISEVPVSGGKVSGGVSELPKSSDSNILLPPKAPEVAGENVRMRNLSARGTQAESVPKPVQEKIAQAPESFYQQQSMRKVVDTVKEFSDADLSAVTQDSPIYTAAKLEQANRLFDAGKNDAGYKVFQDLSQNLTRLGQVINQAKLLNGLNPENVVKVTNESLKKAGRDPLTTKQASELSELSKKRIEAERAMDKATDEWLKNPSDQNAKKAQDAYDVTKEADLALQRKSHQYDVTTWPGMLKAFAQGNPLTPISHIANFLGNTLGAGMEASSRTVAAQFDAIRSALTGKERQIQVQPVRGSIEAGKGFLEGVKELPDIITKGRGETVKGETTKGLQPLRSFVKAFSKNPEGPTVGGKVPLNERVRLAVEGTFGIAPETMLRLLSAADRPAFLSAKSRLIGEQLALTKVPKDQWAMAQKFPELFFDKKTVERIHNEAADAIFQAPSKAVNYLQALINEKTGPWGDLAFTLAVSPYRLTPWNLVKRTLQYNPLVAAAESIVNANKGNVRKAELAAGRMVIGGILYTAGYFLYKNGLVGPSMEGRNESQKARLLAGEVLPPNHVNVSGLKRLINGENPAFKSGDETYDLTRGGGAAGAIITSVANIGREFERKPEDTSNFATQLALHSTLQQASFTVNQSFLKGVTGLLDAVQDRNIGPYINGVENMVLNVPTPNTLSTLSRATREYAPDLKADSFSKEVENVIRNRFGFAGLDDYLPVKRDLWGEPMRQTPEGRSSILYHFFDISKGKQVTDDPVALELYPLWRKTGDSSVIPSLPSRSLTSRKVTYQLTPEQYSRYAELVGKDRRERVEMLVENPFWQDLPEEGKISRLEQAYRRGMETAKFQFLEETPEEELGEKPKRAGFQQ